MATGLYSRPLMSSNFSVHSIDARGLSATDGLLLLVTRSLDKLKAGGILEILSDNPSAEQASFLLSVLGEGTFLDLLRYIETHAPEPATREIARRTRIDETRHVHFALDHIRSALRVDGSLKTKLQREIAERASVLSGIKGLNPLVEESLVILAA